MTQSVTPARLEIQRSSGTIPKADVHLMPFHVAHTGPAPIFTYFRPKPAPPSGQLLARTTTEAVLTQIGKLAVSGSVEDAGGMEVDAEAGDSQTTQAVGDEAPAKEASQPAAAPASNDETPVDTGSQPKDGRLVASFRGRMVQGVPITLPAGYVGLVLKAPAGPSASTTNTAQQSKYFDAQAEKPAKKSVAEKRAAAEAANARRAARRSGRGKAAAPVEVKAEGEDQEPEQEQEQERQDTTATEPQSKQDRDGEESGVVEEVKVLVPTGRFDSFMLWNPDIPVDEGKDEYLRSLTEWIALAAEIHRT